MFFSFLIYSRLCTILDLLAKAKFLLHKENSKELRKNTSVEDSCLISIVYSLPPLIKALTLGSSIILESPNPKTELIVADRFESIARYGDAFVNVVFDLGQF